MALTKWELGGSKDTGYAPSVKCGDLPDLAPLDGQKRVPNAGNLESPDVEGADE